MQRLYLGKLKMSKPCRKTFYKNSRVVLRKKKTIQETRIFFKKRDRVKIDHLAKAMAH